MLPFSTVGASLDSELAPLGQTNHGLYYRMKCTCARVLLSRSGHLTWSVESLRLCGNSSLSET